ncbi:hypothetical protein Phi4:1_gp130 [Cellulophaga phage phi4:1]|uniref:Uncharacterized protein n=5 Tax=Lightbulbvirus TaxID=1918522 RepID=A0A0S2MWM8_9CAUD|nr:hypothetical protein Phi4:1_gp130 [Cellulophaga phage phi4:1]YP_008241629.1 hypothetical protein Phi17:2_gp134 [Cellulophaga phage phi17:2]ALO80139.1 hypothetical protein Phi4113_130 [Cellulophaga phage phi4:1_13]ALO80336.1 hypothetical protein Phi4118_130 [Cellulophaga phage phi4:1_18]ALO80537.1 hypothetical protein Phi17218_134 [Cellulophaga phage phi17:2_18]AGO47667.1 hypothetical protein Phi17:2_gp134 [Cellulophaga phage phi17:2]AGO49543.1 hypothetical protein Phi4:1_gp130 [Cellulophag
MNLEEIRTALKEGKTVYWHNSNYKVVEDNNNKLFITCLLNSNIVLLDEGGENFFFDLFEHYENQPKNLEGILLKWSEKIDEGLNYFENEELLKEVKDIGYTFNYQLNSEPFNLRLMVEEERNEHINKHGLNFDLYLLSDTVIKTEENIYKNQETQYKKSFTKKDLKKWYFREYSN